NTSGWFLLGLAAVALVWLGQTLDEPAAPGGRLRSLGRRAVALALLGAVCVLNPSHVRAFTLPPELRFFGDAAPTRVTSPVQGAYFTNLGLTPASLAYFPLLGLGLLSFLLNRPGWRWQRFLPWLGLALLSALQARAVPFFAVVAGPVLAWNLQEAFARNV